MNRYKCDYNTCNMQSHLIISVPFIWLVSKTPYLIHDHSKAPHITGCGVLLKVQSLQTVTTTE